MLVTCPECEAQVSSKSHACPKCGYDLALPPFYVNSSALGLDLTWLLMDYVQEVDPGRSCYGGGGTREVLVLFGNYDDEMREATKRRGWAILERIQQRITQLSERAEERGQLLLLIIYVQAMRDLAIERSEANLESIAAKLRRFLLECKRDDDRLLFETAIADIQDEITAIKASQAPPSETPQPKQGFWTKLFG